MRDGRRSRPPLPSAGRCALATVALPLALLVPVLAGAAPPPSVLGACASVLRLVADDRTGRPISIGSGFFLSPDGVLASTHQVIVGAQEASALDRGIASRIRSVVDFSLESDVAFLDLGRGGRPLPLAGDGADAAGPLFAVHALPDGACGVAEGRVQPIPSREGESPFLALSFPVAPGMAGAPLLEPGGRVVGMLTRLRREGAPGGLAVPAAVLRRMLTLRPIDMSVADANLFDMGTKAPAGGVGLFEPVTLNEVPSEAGEVGLEVVNGHRVAVEGVTVVWSSSDGSAWGEAVLPGRIPPQGSVVIRIPSPPAAGSEPKVLLLDYTVVLRDVP